MNMLEMDFEEYAKVLSMSVVLKTWHLPWGLTIHAVEYAGSDCLLFSEPINGDSVLIDSDDAAWGGSTHDHLRHAKHVGTL